MVERKARELKAFDLRSAIRKPNEQFGNHRKCEICGTILSRYSSLAERCWLHADRDSERVEAVSESSTRAMYFKKHNRSTCPKGHKKSGANVYIDAQGYRRCLRCVKGNRLPVSIGRK